MRYRHHKPSPTEVEARTLRMPIDDWTGFVPVSAWLTEPCPLHGALCGSSTGRWPELLTLLAVLEEARPGGDLRLEPHVTGAADGRHLAALKEDANGNTLVAGQVRDLDGAFEPKDFS